MLFNAGRNYKKVLIKLQEKVKEYGLQTDTTSGNMIVCMRAVEGALNEREDYSVSSPNTET